MWIPDLFAVQYGVESNSDLFNIVFSKIIVILCMVFAYFVIYNLSDNYYQLFIFSKNDKTFDNVYFSKGVTDFLIEDELVEIDKLLSSINENNFYLVMRNLDPSDKRDPFQISKIKMKEKFYES